MANFLTLENSSRLVLENGSGMLVLENNAPAGPSTITGTISINEGSDIVSTIISVAGGAPPSEEEPMVVLRLPGQVTPLNDSLYLLLNQGSTTPIAASSFGTFGSGRL